VRSGFLVTLFLFVQSLSAQEIKWQDTWPPSCAQVKFEGKRLNKVNFAVYEASGPESKCCEKDKVVFRGRTSTLGHFNVAADLKAGSYYYVAFDAKSGEIQIPIHLRTNFRPKYCDSRDQVYKVKADGTVQLDAVITVD
jgi:hypothetical protein